MEGVLEALLYKEKKQEGRKVERVSVCCAGVDEKGLMRDAKKDLLLINASELKDEQAYIPGTHSENLVVRNFEKVQFKAGDKLRICPDSSPEWVDEHPSECSQLRAALGKALDSDVSDVARFLNTDPNANVGVITLGIFSTFYQKQAIAKLFYAGAIKLFWNGQKKHEQGGKVSLGKQNQFIG
eukprot:CAMPEP_0184026142 /NCGR_PEP_ID=MMETSP0954-20121128/13319_1 /TAXON_ID=627963 /ORGANISM="Aplanochytrium sp, Strain PBS07" /LENGTH=182 /DNA_ID=CAMNT_0026310239 /DNA_START=286 /DNA_END=835 /DNA_ORIENTATION=+